MSGQGHAHHSHKHKKRGPNPVLKAYLLAFNAVSAVAWARVLYLTLWFMLTPRSGGDQLSPGNYKILGHSARSSHPLHYVAQLANHLTGAYNFHGLGEATKYTQTLAVMEVVHAALGWVRSPVGTVASQVASRLWAVWGVVEMVPRSGNNPLYSTMVLAWSITETIRYPFYFFALLGIDVYAIDWLRYTLFLVLYPLGAGSEAFLSFSTLPPLRTLPYVPKLAAYVHQMLHNLPKGFVKNIMKTHAGRTLIWQIAQAKAAKAAGGSWTGIQVARLILFFVWWPALVVLYTYMLKQRRKFFARSKVVGGANKAR